MSKKRQQRNTRKGRKALKSKTNPCPAVSTKAEPRLVPRQLVEPTEVEALEREFTLPGDDIGRVFSTNREYSDYYLELCHRCSHGAFVVDDYLCRLLPHHWDEYGEFRGTSCAPFEEVYNASGEGDDSKRELHSGLKRCGSFDDGYPPRIRRAHIRGDQLGRVFEIIPIEQQAERQPCDTCHHAYQEEDYLICSKLKGSQEGHENWRALEDTTWHTDRVRDGLKFVSCRSHRPIEDGHS